MTYRTSFLKNPKHDADLRGGSGRAVTHAQRLAAQEARARAAAERVAAERAAAAAAAAARRRPPPQRSTLPAGRRRLQAALAAAREAPPGQRGVAVPAALADLREAAEATAAAAAAAKAAEKQAAVDRAPYMWDRLAEAKAVPVKHSSTLSGNEGNDAGEIHRGHAIWDEYEHAFGKPYIPAVGEIPEVIAEEEPRPERERLLMSNEPVRRFRAREAAIAQTDRAKAAAEQFHTLGHTENIPMERLVVERGYVRPRDYRHTFAPKNDRLLLTRALLTPFYTGQTIDNEEIARRISRLKSAGRNTSDATRHFDYADEIQQFYSTPEPTVKELQTFESMDRHDLNLLQHTHAPPDADWKGHPLGRGKMRKLLGKGIWDIVKDAFNPKKVYNEVFNPDSISRRRISDVTKGIRTEYPPSSRKTLEKYADWEVLGLNLRRDVVQSAINAAFNVITMGAWNKAKAETSVDKLFHLGLLITLKKDTQTHQIICEKNEVINIGEVKPIVKGTQFAPVPTPRPPRTLLELLTKAQENVKVEGDFFKYDPFDNNCQDFVANILEANGVYTPQARAFVKQNIDTLISKLPGYTQAVARAITDLGAIANVAVEGAGRANSAETLTPAYPKPAFKTQLEKAGLEPMSYLEEARKRAKEHHYPYKLLGFAADSTHKLAIPDKDGRLVAFGKVGYGDHIIYSHLEKHQNVPKGTADAKRNTFQKSHSKIKGDWASKPFSPNNLALRVLW